MTKREPPSGNVTFLFTDIEGSTWLVQHLGDDWGATLHDHYRLLREAWTAHNGYEVDTEGDAFFVAFADASDAIRAAVDGQKRLAAHRWIGEARLRVRIGMHTGEARVYDGHYVGLAVHQAARVKSAAHGGQILVSQETRDAARGSFEYLDLGLHRLKDLAQPVRICQVLDASLPQEFPSPKSLSVMPNNFPIQSTSFVGRDDDIAQIRDLISASRIVTLTGAGGVGKTRLALQVGAELIDDLRDGAWLIDLARLADPSAVAVQIADVLGVREQAGRPITATLVDHLREKDMLLIVDNCEHLIDACAEIVHLVASSCANVKILATSREALNVAGEHSHRVRSLSVPELDGDLEPVAKAEAVQLFYQCVRAARADFELTVDNAGAITQICRRLDGLPLAIELAAARCRSMSPKDVAGRLDDRFRLLTGGSRMALPRQRTLEATVVWSYELLRPEEQRVFERLSVFAGGCTLDAAERICSDDGIGVNDVDDAVATLVDRSLVVIEEDVDGHTRYRLLETLRQFGRDRLLERGELAKMRELHLDWVVDVSAQLFDQQGKGITVGSFGAMQPAEIQTDDANVRAAIEWAIETGDHAAGLHIVANVWALTDHLGDCDRWYAQLLDSVDDVPPDVAARALAAAGGLSLLVGDWATGTERFSKAIEVAKSADNRRLHSKSLLYAGACRFGLRDDDIAMTLMEEGLRVARDVGDDEMVRLALVFLSHSECGRDLDRALELAERCDAMSRQDGSLFDRAHALEALGLAHALRGDLGRSARLIAESMPLMAQVYAGCAAHLLETAAATLIMAGDVETAAELVGSAERIREETGDKPRPWERLVQEEWLPRIRSELDPAVYEQAVARGRSRRWEDALAFAAGALTRARDEDEPPIRPATRPTRLDQS